MVKLRPEYSLGGFTFKPPTVEGWRQVSADSRGLEFVYAERIDESRLNTKAHIQVRTVDIPPDAQVATVQALAELSRVQQVGALGTFVVEPGKVEPVSGSDQMMTYTIVSRLLGDMKLHDAYFVALAGDKSEYAVVKFQTQENAYKDTLFFAQFFGSIASLKAASKNADDG